MARGECPRCMRYRAACICNRATRVTTKGLKPVKPRGAAAVKPKGVPRPCTQLCGFDRKTRTRTACTSTVRGGQCPCPNC